MFSKFLRWLKISAVACISLLFFATTGTALNVVTTTSDLASIAKAIGGDRVKVQSLQDGSRDPHFLQAKPSYIMMARSADLWIRVGMELEIGYEPVIIDASRNPRIRIGKAGHLDVSKNVIRLDVPAGKIDRSMGDVHPEGNPHYWIDPYNGRIIAKTISERLKQLDPDNASIYEVNLAVFQKKLDTAMFGEMAVKVIGGENLWKLQSRGELEKVLKEKDVEVGGWHAILLPYRGTRIGSQHRSWNYLLSRFGLNLAVELEPKPGIPPSPEHLKNVIELVKKQNVHAFMVEPFYSHRAADFVSERTGIKVIVCTNSTGGQPEASDYIAMINNAVCSIAKSLREQ